MKKGYEWLNCLSAKDQVLFCKNLTNLGKWKISEYLIDDYSSVGTFISSAFVWSASSEGDEYWSELLADKNF
jgi:hypothetical protein